MLFVPMPVPVFLHATEPKHLRDLLIDDCMLCSIHPLITQGELCNLMKPQLANVKNLY